MKKPYKTEELNEYYLEQYNFAKDCLKLSETEAVNYGIEETNKAISNKESGYEYY